MREIVVNNSRREHNPFAPGAAQPYSYMDYIHEAVVVDVVVNDEHPEYKNSKDGYNVGTIKFRLLKTNIYRDDGSLNWAFPLESNITEYPLVGELVLITSALNRFFYSRKLNITSRVTAQALSKLNDEYQPVLSGMDKTDSYRKTQSVPNKEVGEKRSLGKYFKDNPDIYRLKSFEGDIIWEGRSGQSIRFGSAFKSSNNFKSTTVDQAPNIILRVGQSKTISPSINSQFGLVLEDINNDLSSIWVVSDQIIPLQFSTETNKSIHGKSISDFPSTLSGNQIVLNSDRVILNAKSDKVLIHASSGIHLTTLRNVTTDMALDNISLVGRDEKNDVLNDRIQIVGRDSKFWAGRDYLQDISRNYRIFANGTVELRGKGRLSIIGKKVYIGSESSGEHMVMGDSLNEILIQMINAILSSSSRYVFTSSGPGRLNPQTQAALQQIKSKLQEKIILSEDNFVSKKNQTPGTLSTKPVIH